MKGRKLKLESAVKKARGRNAAKETENSAEEKPNKTEDIILDVKVDEEEKVEVAIGKVGKEKKEKKIVKSDASPVAVVKEKSKEKKIVKVGK